MRTGTITHPNTHTHTHTKKAIQDIRIQARLLFFLKLMVGAHIRLYSEKVVTDEMPVEAVHTLSLFKLS